MVVARKPKSVDEFINDGGSVPQTIAPVVVSKVESSVEKEEEKGLKLRLPLPLLQQVDAVVASRRPVPSRHQWILEAIYEKLDREAGFESPDATLRERSQAMQGKYVSSREPKA